jgi:MoxR-like ATPase
MSEGQVSIEGRTYVLSSPFFVLATQNPYEYAGTYPLPENQLDRFMLCTSIGYPERNVEKLVLASHRDGEEVDRLEPVLTAEELRQMQSSVREIAVDESINEYLLDIIAATRQHDELELGVSTRGALTLYRAAQSMAFVENRKYVIPDDVKRLAIPVLAHRVVCRGLIREGQRERAENIIRRILQQTAVPD